MVGLALGFLLGLIVLSYGWIEEVNNTDHLDRKDEDYIDFDDNKSHTENF
jgi:hypothetical protein